MRRFICLMLALILCMAMPLTAFASSVAQSGTPAVTTGTNPKTGDIGMMELWVPVLVISALALMAVAVIYFKKVRKAD